MRFSFATIPTTQFFVKDREPNDRCMSQRLKVSNIHNTPSASRRMLCKTFLMMTGLKTFN